MPITDYYVTTDAMGSVTAVLDEAGNVLERRSYDAFGEATYMLPDGTVVANSPTGVDIGFQGQLMDELTGMYQMGYRWYSPVLGRWVSRDPIGLEGGVNPMAFAGNVPTQAFDSFGLEVVVESIDGKTVVTEDSRQLVIALADSPSSSIRRITFYGHACAEEQTFNVLDKNCRERVRNERAGETTRRYESSQSIVQRNVSPSAVVVGPSLSTLLKSRLHDNFFVKNAQGAAIGYDLRLLLENKMAKEAEIYLRGCETAKASDVKSGVTIAVSISKSAPDTPVYGYDGGYLLFGRNPILDGMPTLGSSQKKFKNGIEVE